MKKIVEYLPLLTICLLYFGFCNLYYYYKEFNVDIYSYISSTDILLSFFPKIVLFTSLIYGAILSQLFETIKKPSNKTVSSDNENPPVKTKTGKTKLEWWRTHIYYIVAFYYGPVIILILILQKGFHYKSYELVDLNMIFDFVFLALIYIGIVIHEKRSSIFEKPILIALFLIVFIGQKIGSYRINEAQKIKEGKSDYKRDHLSFKYNDMKIKTEDSILFVGETSIYVFMYDVKDSTTKVYPFSKIEDIIIK